MTFRCEGCGTATGIHDSDCPQFAPVSTGGAALKCSTCQDTGRMNFNGEQLPCTMCPRGGAAYISGQRDAVSPTDTALDLERAFRTIEKFPRSGASLVTKEGIKAEFARYRSALEKLASCEPLSPESGAGYITHEVAERIRIAQEALKNG